MQMGDRHIKTSTISQKKVFAALPHVDRGRAVRLSGDPEGVNILYCNGHNVYVRNLKDPSQVDIYTGHSKSATVARYSPSRLYIASADVSGKVRIWDAVRPEHPLKAEYTVLCGLVNDLDWSPDSQYLVVCGNSNDKFATVFSVHNGSPCGTLEGHNKMVNTCSYRQVRPFYIVTASEDNTVGFHGGLPFKLKAIQKFHINYATVARYSRNGDTILSGGADGKLYRYRYDGNTPDESETKQIGSPAHKADIYELCYSPDDKQVLTVSRDKTAKVFDVQSGDLVLEFTTSSSKDWMDTHLGCLWQAGEMVTVNSRGHLIYLNQEDPLQPKTVVKYSLEWNKWDHLRFLVELCWTSQQWRSAEHLEAIALTSVGLKQGHMKPIMAMAISIDRTTIFTGGQEGIKTGVNDEVSGTGRPGDIVDMAIDNDDLVYVCRDQTVRFASVTNRTSSDGEVKLDSHPTAVDVRNGIIVVACDQHVTVLEGKQKPLVSVVLKSPALCVSIHPARATIAVGHKDQKLRIMTLYGGILYENRIVEMCGEISVVVYSPCGAYLAVGTQRRVSALTATDYKELSKGEVHSARLCCAAWSPDSSRFVTAALDGKVILWDDVNESYKARPTVQAHTKSHANKIAWLNTSTIVTAGQDCNVKQFTVSDQ